MAGPPATADGTLGGRSGGWAGPRTCSDRLGLGDFDEEVDCAALPDECLEEICELLDEHDAELPEQCLDEEEREEDEDGEDERAPGLDGRGPPGLSGDAPPGLADRAPGRPAPEPAPTPEPAPEPEPAPAPAPAPEEPATEQTQPRPDRRPSLSERAAGRGNRP